MNTSQFIRSARLILAHQIEEVVLALCRAFGFAGEEEFHLVGNQLPGAGIFQHGLYPGAVFGRDGQIFSDLAQQGSQTDSVATRQRAARLQQLVTLYSAMRPGDAATIFDKMPDDMVLELLPLLKDRQAARILNGLADQDRKAKLSAQLLLGQQSQ